VAHLDGPREVAVVTSRDSVTDPFATSARRTTAPGAVVVVGSGDGSDGADDTEVPALLRSRPVTDRPIAYVCRGFV
jgi:hypothetical protein